MRVHLVDGTYELFRHYFAVPARQNAKGYAFGPDTPWQRELEDAFPYTETPDQLAAIEEVKTDMERAVPMDRLICGDVSYGKTEVALRASLLAVLGGKQVAVLAPTTVLAEQHFVTFSERYTDLPVRLAALSRLIMLSGRLDTRRIISTRSTNESGRSSPIPRAAPTRSR